MTLPADHPRLVAAKTNIPIPRIHAYSAPRAENILSFIILDYVPGRTLFDVKLSTLSDHERRHLYDQLADIYIQLRRLEFMSIGALSCDSTGFGVHKMPISISTNEQELEGLGPWEIQASYGSRGVLTSASSYASMLMHVARNAFEKSRKSVYSEADGNETLYNLHMFSQFATEKWLDPVLDSGPFVLTHGDLNPHNLMVNEDMDIVALLDWEWSRVVPLQFFVPPTWLTDRETDSLAWPVIYARYVNELDKFRTIVRDRELARYGERLLSRDWARVHENGGILVPCALENWTDIDYFAGRYLDKILYGRRDLNNRVEEFMKEDPARQALVATKVRDRMAYRAKRKLLNIQDPADDEAEEGDEAASSWQGSTFLSLPRWLRSMAEAPPYHVLWLAMGTGSALFLGGGCYIIWSRLIRYPFRPK